MTRDASSPPLRLYGLKLADGYQMSPYVWRAQYALAFKDLAFEGVPVGFIEIPDILGGRFKTVPVLEDGGEAIVDSWAIADHLDRAHPQRLLFASPGERAMIRFFDSWFLREVSAKLFQLYVLDIHDHLRPEDQAYFRSSREARFGGRTLEEVAAGRESRLPALHDALQPLRATLAAQPWLGGEAPNYADYIALGGFLWIAGVATLPPLAADDPLCGWLERGFDLYGGLGRDRRQQPLWA